MVSAAYFASQRLEGAAQWGASRDLAALGAAGPSRLGPGDALLVGFPPRREAPFFWRETQAEITAQGSAEQPAHLAFGLMQADGGLAPAPRTAPAQLRMARAGFPRQAAPEPYGKPYMILTDPSQVELSGPRFDGCGAKGFFRLVGAGQGLAFSDLHARMAGRAIETEAGSRFSDVVIARSTVYGAIRGFARFHELSAARFVDLDLDAGGIDGGGKRVCQLISVRAGSDLRFERVHLRRAVNLLDAEARGSTYVQGDGVVLEEDTSGATFVDCHARGFGDAGFDMKCDGIRFLRCSVRGCKYGVRVWRDAPGNLLEMCTISDPVPRPDNAAACLWVGGQVTLRHCALSTAPEAAVIRFGKGPDTKERVVRMTGGRIEIPPGGALLAGEPGRLEMTEVMLGPERVTGVATWTGRELVRG